MKLLSILALTAAAATPALAEQTRQLDAHVHGVGQLDIAFDGEQIAMAFRAPGADIVGFEYEAESAEDRAAIDAAVATLARPLDLFVLHEAAGCSVVQASAELESEEDHDDHGDHGDEQAEAHDHDDHGHDEHAHYDHGHDDHGHEEHAEEDHSDHDHGDHDHASEASHTEFHAEYLLNCADPSAVSDITFAYFDTFPNALEVEVQVISDTGATAFEVERDAPNLDLQGMF
ncbi:MAG: DUF2796 domain-containing protein [Pseudomonadota bacterium]